MSARASEIQMSQPHTHTLVRPWLVVVLWQTAILFLIVPSCPEERSAHLCGDIPSKAASGLTKQHLQLMVACRELWVTVQCNKSLLTVLEQRPTETQDVQLLRSSSSFFLFLVLRRCTFPYIVFLTVRERWDFECFDRRGLEKQPSQCTDQNCVVLVTKRDLRGSHAMPQENHCYDDACTCFIECDRQARRGWGESEEVVVGWGDKTALWQRRRW